MYIYIYIYIYVLVNKKLHELWKGIWGLHKKEWRQDSDAEHMLYCNQLSWEQ